MPIPLAKALDALTQCILKPMKLDSGGHGFPVFDKKLKGGYDLPDSGHMLT